MIFFCFNLRAKIALELNGLIGRCCMKIKQNSTRIKFTVWRTKNTNVAHKTWAGNGFTATMKYYIHILSNNPFSCIISMPISFIVSRFSHCKKTYVFLSPFSFSFTWASIYIFIDRRQFSKKKSYLLLFIHIAL